MKRTFKCKDKIRKNLIKASCDVTLLYYLFPFPAEINWCWWRKCDRCSDCI